MFDSERAINLALSINCNLQDTVFVKSFPSLSILVTSLSIENEKIMYFSIVFPKQLSCPSKYSASFFL